MFFLQTKRNKKQRQTKIFSNVCRNVSKGSQSFDYEHPLMCKRNKRARRTVFSLSMNLRGSMTLEAGMVLPLFVLLILALLSLMDMLRLQAVVTWKIHQIGNEIGLYGTLLTNEKEDNIFASAAGGVTLSYLYIKEELEKTVDFPDKVFFTTIKLFEEEMVEVAITYNYPLIIGVGKWKEVWLQSKYCGKVWNGLEEKNTTENCVYVTESGDVYHAYLDCSHLQLDIQEIPKGQKTALEECLGKTLYPCTICNDVDGDLFFVTLKQGRYHCDRDCANLKRTIYAKELSWAKEKYKPCERCEKRMME